MQTTGVHAVKTDPSPDQTGRSDSWGRSKRGVKKEGEWPTGRFYRAVQRLSQLYAAKTRIVRSLAPLFQAGNESV
jgi:hypothetical protein